METISPRQHLENRCRRALARYDEVSARLGLSIKTGKEEDTPALCDWVRVATVLDSNLDELLRYVKAIEKEL